MVRLLTLHHRPPCPLWWRAFWIAASIAVFSTAGCSKPPPADPLQLAGNVLTVDNRTSDDWTDVEIWINRQFRLVVPKIAASSRFQAPLDIFVTGYGHRFNFSRMQLIDLRLSGKRAGKPFELQKEFSSGALADTLKRLGGKR